MKNDNWKANGDKRKGIIKCEKKENRIEWEKIRERERSSTIYWMNH